VPTWKIELIEEAVADFKKLDGSVRKAVLRQLAKLEKDPRYGQPLGNKAGFDLEGYFKLYAENKKIRIVYDVCNETIRIIAIDRREEMEVYRIAMKRIKER